MKRNTEQTLRIRLNPERNQWDRAIVDWLKTLPSGYRSKILKETIVRALGKQAALATPSVPHEESRDVRSKLGRMFNA